MSEEELGNICEDVHHDCCDDCPVFAVNDSVPLTEDKNNCVCFKDGKKMQEFLNNP